MATVQEPLKTVELFFSYSHKDEALRGRLEEHLAVLRRQGVISGWHDRKIGAGEEWRGKISQHLESAHIILLLISPSFLNSDYCVDIEMDCALRRHDANEARVIPVLLRSVQWTRAPFARLNVIPRNAKPVNRWRDREEAFSEIAREIGNAVDELLAGHTPPEREPEPPVAVKPRTPKKPVVVVKPPPRPEPFDNPYGFAPCATREMFKGRENEIEELVDAIASGTHTAVFGLQRIGKTSLVEEVIEDRIPRIPGLKDSILFAKVDFQKLGSEYPSYKDVFHAMAFAIQNELLKSGVTRRGVNLKAAVDEFVTAGRYDRGNRAQIFAEFTKVLTMTAEVARRRIILFLDEFSETRKVIERHEFLTARNPGRNVVIHPHEMLVDVPFMHYLSSLLRDNALKGKVSFIFAVRPYMSEYDAKRSLQILKLTKSITLYYLDEAAALALITEPLRGRIEYEPGAPDYLYRLTAGHPYLIQYILHNVVARIQREGRRLIRLEDIQRFEDKMVSEGPGYDAQFEVIDSDYSVDEVLNVDRARWGKGTLALVAKIGTERPEGWVDNDLICEELGRRGIPRQNAVTILSYLVRAKILDERTGSGDLQFRMSIPLLRKRYVKQNMFEKYFLHARKP